MGTCKNGDLWWNWVGLKGLIVVVAVLGMVMESASGESGGEVDFAREVLPILSDKCYYCHGPDTKNKKDLRLDSYEEAVVDLGGYKALDPENPGESEIIARMFDKEDPMPPEDAEKQLTEREKEIIRKWVMSGGNYARHWAFVKPEKSAIKGRDSHPIDAFIEPELKKAGRSMSSAADQRVLARRAALVLTGLPPEVSQLESFINDKSSNAFENYVDALLSDPLYGEHQARYWMDAVRYGDTHGLHLDNKRGIFPYRDWIVRSLNENLPFDESIRWQLAGDLLPDPTMEQILATGYVRMNPTTSEGGAIPAEFQAKNNFDRTETLGTVFLGMTLSCSRCHNHKYDPISQKEYYQLFSFFNSTAEGSMDGNAYVYGPVARVPQSQVDWNRWNFLKSAGAQLIKEAEGTGELKPEALVEYAKAYQAPKLSEWKISKGNTKSGVEHSGIEWKDQKGLPGSIGDSLPSMGQSRWIQFSVERENPGTLWMNISGGIGTRAIVNGHEFLGGAINDQQKTVIPVPVEAGRTVVVLEVTGNAFGNQISVSLQDPWKKLREAGDWEKLKDEEQVVLLADKFGPFGEAGVLKNRMMEAAKGVLVSEANFTTSLVAKELDKPRETYLLNRGEYSQPIGDPVEPDVIQVMGGMKPSMPKNRLGLAEWLVSPDHPTVSRVLVNQLWIRIFGAGLVRSPEDFGLQGQHPTHPELLDWLAVEFQESGWNIKHMLKLMVTSRAFRQDSSMPASGVDPANLLWGRGPSYRLDAEVIRDIALWSSGALNEYMGGEGVKPYQPEGMWFALAHPGSNTKRYVPDQSDRQYRRSLYVYWKRTSPHPMMTLFDAPSRESSCVGRSRTNTPLQSLGLLNESQRVELGRVYAGNLLKESGNDLKRLEDIFLKLTSRKPSEKEARICMDLLAQMKARFRDDVESANRLVSVGAYSRVEGVDAVEHAAWTQVVITLLASDLSILLY